jgi:xeroderma pigmentosum group C-complementing protein
MFLVQEHAEFLMDAWNKDQEEKLRKEAEKKEKRALDNWKKLIKGMLMHQKIRNKYLGKDKH